MAIFGVFFVVSSGLMLLHCDATTTKECSNKPPHSPVTSYRYFGQRTLYDVVRGNLPEANSTTGLGNCTAVHVYVFARHGARYPHKGAVGQQRKLLKIARDVNKTGSATLCSEVLQAIRDWSVWTDESTNKNQTVYGDSEIRGIAQRLKRMTPELFKGDPSLYRFRSTDYQRTKASMRVFAEEVLREGDLPRADLQVVARENDRLLLFYEHCKKFLTVSKHRKRKRQYLKFLSGPVFRQLVTSVGRRLGLPRGYLNPYKVFKMYKEGCYLEQWVTGENGAWCFPFSAKDLKALDYASDLREYWLRRNRNDVTRKQSCEVAKEIVSTFRSVSLNGTALGSNQSMGTFRFGHVTGVLSTAANLGMYEEGEKLTASNFARKVDTRKFKMSELIPSAGNIILVLYRCQGNQFKVTAFLNERPVALRGCAQDQMCDLEVVLNRYSEFVRGSENECNFDRICENQ